jgi:hypothetical protein
VASGPDKATAIQYCQMGCARGEQDEKAYARNQCSRPR